MESHRFAAAGSATFGRESHYPRPRVALPSAASSATFGRESITCKAWRRSEAQHCSSFCSQSEGDENCGGPARAENSTKLCPRALVMFATCSWPSLCEQSELQCWRRNLRRERPERAASSQPRATPWVSAYKRLRPVRAKVWANGWPLLLPLQVGCSKFRENQDW